MQLAHGQANSSSMGYTHTPVERRDEHHRCPGVRGCPRQVRLAHGLPFGRSFAIFRIDRARPLSLWMLMGIIRQLQHAAVLSRQHFTEWPELLSEAAYEPNAKSLSLVARRRSKEEEVDEYDGSYACVICSESVRDADALCCLQCSSNPFHASCVVGTAFAEPVRCAGRTVVPWTGAKIPGATSSATVDLTGSEPLLT